MYFRDKDIQEKLEKLLEQIKDHEGVASVEYAKDKYDSFHYFIHFNNDYSLSIVNEESFLNPETAYEIGIQVRDTLRTDVPNTDGGVLHHVTLDEIAKKCDELAALPVPEFTPEEKALRSLQKEYEEKSGVSKCVISGRWLCIQFDNDVCMGIKAEQSENSSEMLYTVGIHPGNDFRGRYYDDIHLSGVHALFNEERADAAPIPTGTEETEHGEQGDGDIGEDAFG